MPNNLTLHYVMQTLLLFVQSKSCSLEIWLPLRTNYYRSIELYIHTILLELNLEV